MNQDEFLATSRVLARSSPEHANNYLHAYEGLHKFSCNKETIATLDPEHVKWCLDILFAATAYADSAAGVFAKQIILNEINRGPKCRFSVETIVSWVSACSARNWSAELQILVDACDHNGVCLPPEEVIGWAMECLHSSKSRKIGSLLLLRKDCVENPKLDLWHISEIAISAAREGDHAVTRLFPLLLQNWVSKKRNVLPRKKLERLSEIIVKASVEDGQDPEFLAMTLLRCAKSHLGPKTFTRLLELSDAKICEHESFIARATKNRRVAFKTLRS